MRVIVALISVLFTATTAAGHPPAPLEQPPDIQIVKYAWAKERIDWEKTPFGRRTEISDIRSRRGSILEERQARETTKSKEKPAEPPRYVFQYKVIVFNDGPKAITEVDWDYVFTDAATAKSWAGASLPAWRRLAPGSAKNYWLWSRHHLLEESALTRSEKMSATASSSASSLAASFTMTEQPGRPLTNERINNSDFGTLAFHPAEAAARFLSRFSRNFLSASLLVNSSARE